MSKNALVIILLVCLNTLSFAQSTKQPAKGGNKDSHGCIPSAGYTFSVLKNECIRVFEQKIQLKEVKPVKSYTSIAALIFSPDRTKVEVFLPGNSASILLPRSGQAGKYAWKNDSLTLLKQKGYVLKRNNKVIFSGA